MKTYNNDYYESIDGLRAIAVMLVIGFHAGIPYLNSGFIGVDIFFTISGFLITSVILSMRSFGQKILVGFYKRRFLRILPALYFMISAVIIVSLFLLAPSQVYDLSRSIVYIIFFTANMFFLFNTDYFNADPENNLFLHTWSLSIEEQFYFVFPVIVLILRKLDWSLMRSMIILSLVSLSLAMIFGDFSQDAVFYVLVFRFWEFSLGSVAYLYLRDYKPISRFYQIIGFIFIIISVLVISKGSTWPSVITILPVIGTALILVSREPTPVLRFVLCNSYFRHIGKLSYSLYLWHWPIFILVPLLDIQFIDSLFFKILIVYMFSAISYYFVEQPFRADVNLKSWLRFRSGILIGASAVIFVISLMGIFSNGIFFQTIVPENFLESVKRTEKENMCFQKGQYGTKTNWYCLIGAENEQPKHIIFGDSHVLHYMDSLGDYFEAVDESAYVISAPGCLPFLGIYSLRFKGDSDQCRQLNIRVANLTIQKNIENLILAARWNYYTGTGMSTSDISYYGLSADDPKSISQTQLAYKEGLVRTLKYYKRIGVNLVVLGQVPHQRGRPVDLHVQRARNNQSVDEVSVSLLDHAKDVEWHQHVFEQYGINSYDPTLGLCNVYTCPYGDEDRSYYYDDDHLSVAGAEKLQMSLSEYLIKTLKN